MKKKDRRAKERRKRQRARRKARETRQAARGFRNRPKWWLEGLEETPTKKIVATLARLTIQTDEGRFREQALARQTVDALAEAWLTQSTATGIWEDYPWLATRALWPRWVPRLRSPLHGLSAARHPRWDATIPAPAAVDGSSSAAAAAECP